jgi:hypothetical protein
MENDRMFPALVPAKLPHPSAKKPSFCFASNRWAALSVLDLISR